MEWHLVLQQTIPRVRPILAASCKRYRDIPLGDTNRLVDAMKRVPHSLHYRINLGGWWRFPWVVRMGDWGGSRRFDPPREIDKLGFRPYRGVQ